MSHPCVTGSPASHKHWDSLDLVRISFLFLWHKPHPNALSPSCRLDPPLSPVSLLIIIIVGLPCACYLFVVPSPQSNGKEGPIAEVLGRGAVAPRSFGQELTLLLAQCALCYSLPSFLWLKECKQLYNPTFVFSCSAFFSLFRFFLFPWSTWLHSFLWFQ